MTNPETDTPGIRYPYPLDEHLQEIMAAKTALMRAKELNLVTGARIVDFANPTQVHAFESELGSNAIRPQDNGVYFLFWIRSDADEGPTPYLLPVDGVIFFLRGVAARDSFSTAQEFTTRPGEMPLHDPVAGD